MNIIPHIRKNLLIFLKEAKVNIISFILLPMVLAFIYGIMQANMFEGKYTEVKELKVNFIYDKSTSEGEILTEILSDKNIKGLIVYDQKAEDFIVNISNDFKKVNIKANVDDGLQIAVLQNFMTTFIDNTNQYEKIEGIIGASGLSKEKGMALGEEIIATTQRLNAQSSVKEKIVEGYKTLGAREYFTISMFSFSIILMIQVLAKSFYRDKKNGIIKRSFVTNCNKSDYYFGFIVSNLIQTAIIATIYVMLNRILGIAFLGDLTGVLLIVLTISLFISAISGVIVAFFKEEKSANIFMIFLIALPLVIGGVFVPSYLIDSKVLQYISKIAPNTLIIDSFKNFAISGTISSISIELISAIVIAVILITVGYYKIKVKWEV